MHYKTNRGINEDQIIELKTKIERYSRNLKVIELQLFDYKSYLNNEKNKSKQMIEENSRGEECYLNNSKESNVENLMRRLID